MSCTDYLYECLYCQHQEIVKASDPRKDGRSCSKCGKHTTLLWYRPSAITFDEMHEYPNKLLQSSVQKKAKENIKKILLDYDINSIDYNAKDDEYVIYLDRKG